MTYVSSNFKRLIRLAARGNSKEIVYSEGNNLQKTIKAGDEVITAVLKQNLNVTLSQLLSLAIDAPKEATRRAVCFAPNMIRLARSKMARSNRPELKQRIDHFFKDSGMYVIRVNTLYHRFDTINIIIICQNIVSRNFLI